MKISKIEIKNFRNFKHVIVDTAQSMVLVGANDVGKSNFIYALRLVLDKRLSIFDRKLSADDFWQGIEPWGGEIIQIMIQFTDYENDINQRCLLDTHTDGRVGYASLTYVYEPKPEISDPKKAKENDYHAFVYGGGDKQKNVGWSYLNNLNLSYIDALRNAETELVAKRQPLKNLMALYDINADALKDAESHIQALNDVVGNTPEIKNLETDVNRILSEMKEHIHELDPVLRLIANDADAILRSLRMLLHTNRLLALNTTSLGLANLLYLALYLLDIEKREKIEKPTSGDEYELIVPAIEEPEAHLHPHIQRLLFEKFMERKHVPLILSTHSPYIASVAPVDSILMFRKINSEKTTQITSTANLRSQLTDEIEFDDLQRYLNVTHAELLFARAILFVEGVSEEFMIPSLAKMIGIDLDKYGITVCNINGMYFGPYLKLVGKKGLQIPFAVLTDGDKHVDSEDYYGLKRSIKLLDCLDIDSASLTEAYNKKDWPCVFETLAQSGIFVNEWSLEPSLIKCGFAEGIFEVLKESERIGPKVLSSLKQDLSNNSLSKKRIEYWLEQINSVSKGRVSQQLSTNLDREPLNNVTVPQYIQDAIKYLVSLLDNDNKNVQTQQESENLDIVYWVKQSGGQNTQRVQNHLHITFLKTEHQTGDMPQVITQKIKEFLDQELKDLMQKPKE